MKTIEEKRKYWRDYANKNKHKYRYKNGIHIEVLRRFGRDPKIIFQRDGWKCRICKSGKKLTIDHIDGNGRYSEKPNNKLSNLRTLCKSCHGRIDRKRGWSNLKSIHL